MRDQAALDQLTSKGQLVLRYASANGQSNGEQLPFPENPNGSIANAAGLCDSTGRVLGLMPHPERFIDRTQHPSWTRRHDAPQQGEGLQLFKNAVAYFG